jgi:hypothetical protein
MGMRLNGEKTYHSDDIVNSSIKKDKLHQIIITQDKLSISSVSIILQSFII